MSAQYEVGQQVSGDDYERLPIGASAEDADGVAITKAGGDPILWKTDAGKICWPLHPRTLTHLPDATEPEDKADLYVEPEPLKGGDWVQVWAQVEDEKYINTESNVLLSVVDIDDAPGTVWARYDAIVRPGAGQVPPWVKPAKSEAEELAEVIGCEHHGAEYGVCSVCVEMAERAIDAGWRRTEGGAS